MIMSTPLTSFRPRQTAVGKAELRSQNVAFTLHPMPLSMVSFAEEVVDLAKRILSGVHGSTDRIYLLDYPHLLPKFFTLEE